MCLLGDERIAELTGLAMLASLVEQFDKMMQE